MLYRTHNPEQDKKAVRCIWREVGWIEKDDSKPMDYLLEAARTIVVDQNGELEWQEAYGTEDGELCMNLIQTSDNGYCIVGGSRYDGGAHNYHPYILRISGNGDLIWHRIYDDIRGISLEDVDVTCDL